MQFSSILLVAGLSALTSAAPPAPPALAGLPLWANSFSNLAKSFNMNCDVSAVTQPKPAGTALPSPPGKLVVVAIGKGTQNYTCPSPAVATAAPTAIGAKATLYDASCLASRANADAMHSATTAVYSMNDDSPMLKAMPIAGYHWFPDTTTPAFAMNGDLGTAYFKKNASTAAPTTAQNAVAWLYLTPAPGQNVKGSAVYRLDTDNGAAPTTCGDKEGHFEVPYTAQYWFYEH